MKNPEQEGRSLGYKGGRDGGRVGGKWQIRLEAKNRK